jgi:hypothetical protein
MNDRRPSPIYKNPYLYQLFMRLLYGRFFEVRFSCISDQIPNGVSVVDVCAGNVYLYSKYLKMKAVQYLSLDNSPEFINWANKYNVNAQIFDLRNDPLPRGDFVVMMASLYQFLPEARVIIKKLIESACDKVIISEPVSNLSSSQIGFIARLAHLLSIPYNVSPYYSGVRFTQTSLVELFNSFTEYERSFSIPGGREIVGIFKGKASKL